MPQNRLSCPVGYQTTLKNNTEQLRAFLEALELGQIPTFLELMAAFSNVSEMFTPNIPCRDCEAHR